VADRTVSAKLRLDIAGYVASAHAAAAATRQIADEADKASRRSAESFKDTGRSAVGMTGSLKAAGATARRAGADIEKAALGVRKAHLAAADATDKAERSAKAAAEASERLARGEIDESEAARLVTRASRDAERASIAHAEANRRGADEADRHAGAQQRLGRELQTTTRGLTANRSTLVSLITAGAGAGAAMTSAGAAFVAFGAVAAPSIVKVVAAQKDLTGSLGSLSRQQTVSAFLVRGLVDDYKALAKSYEPEALAAFNSVVGTTRTLMGPLGALVDRTSGSVLGFTNRINAFVEGDVTRFLGFAGQQAPHALDVLGDTLTTTGSLALQLVQDLTPMGLTLLSATNSTLGLVNALARAHPALAEAAVVAIALRSPVSALSGLWAKGSAGIARFAAETKGATVAQKALGLVTKAGPGLYIAAGLALVYLAARLSSVRDATDGLIDRLRTQTQAFGNNIAGYQALASALTRQIALQKQAFIARYKDTGAIAEGDNALRHYQQGVDKLTKAYQEAVRAQTNITQGSAALAREFGITSEQAIGLANAAGVDLSKGILKSGELTEQARQKIAAYRAAVVAASDPTRVVSNALKDAGNSALLMKDRVTALTAALDAYYNPSIAVYKATIALKQGYQSLLQSLSDAKGHLDSNSAASLRAQQAFAAQTDAVSTLYQATFRQTGSVEKANAAIRGQLPILYALAGGSADARAQVNALANSTGNAGAAANVSKGQFLAMAHQMGIGKDRAAALWKEFVKVRSQLGAVSGQAGATGRDLDTLARERHLRMEIQGWQRALARAKADLATVPKSKQSEIKARIAQLEAAIRKAKAELASLHDKTVVINEVTRHKIIGKGPGHAARGGIFRRSYAKGGIRSHTHSYADGGTHEGLPPHIAEYPSVLYGEPETGGEAFIPLGHNKRARSTMLLGEVAGMFGYGLVRMAAGGAPAGGAATPAPVSAAPAAPAGQQRAFENQLKTTRDLTVATAQHTQATGKATAAGKAQVPVLANLTTRSRETRAQVDALTRATTSSTGRQTTATAAFGRVGREMGTTRGRTEALWREYSRVPAQTSRAAGGVESFSGRTRRSLGALRSKSLNVHVFADGKFRKASALAGGGPVPAGLALGAGGPTSDDVPIWGSVGEHMITAREVRAAGGHDAVYRMRKAMLRGDMRGFAQGGAVDFSARVPTAAATSASVGVGAQHLKLLKAGQAAFEEAHSLAVVWKKYAASGGPVVAAARSQIGLPYSWGGGGLGGPSYGIGRGAHTFGFDCSGLTQYAWGRGRGIDIGGTTGPQHATSRAISGWRPGALAFPHSGHVMLGSSRPGYIIQAPHTGGHVEEVRRSAGDWRWPARAGAYAEGGPVTRGETELGDKFLRTRSRAIIIEAKQLQIAGDPGGVIPGYASGGWVHGNTGPDRVPLMGAGGEFMVNRTQAGKYAPLVEAINADRVGDALLRSYIRGGPVPARTLRAGGGAQTVRVEFAVNGTDQDMKRMIQRMVRVDGRGDVQVAFGKRLGRG
jgi:cell wall-associated NlpC family hydrolase